MHNQALGAVQEDPIYVKKKDIFVGNLSLFTSAEKLRDYFLPYGEISDVRIIMHANSGRSRRFGFITFSEEKTVDAVFKSKDHFHLDGKDLDVKNAYKRSDEEGGLPPVLHPKKPFIPKELYDQLEPSQRSKIFLGGLMQEIEEKDVREYFSKFGEIDSLHLVMDQVTKKSKGFAFLTFSEEQSAIVVCDVRFHTVKGKTVEAKPAMPKPSRSTKPHPPLLKAPPAPPSTPIQYFSAWPQVSAAYWNSYVFHLNQPRFSPYSTIPQASHQALAYSGLYPIQALYQASSQLVHPFSPAIIEAKSVPYSKGSKRMKKELSK